MENLIISRFSGYCCKNIARFLYRISDAAAAAKAVTNAEAKVVI